VKAIAATDIPARGLATAVNPTERVAGTTIIRVPTNERSER
jgi:hypothetical protein